MADGLLSLEDDTGRVEELQGLLEKQNFELSQARERLVTLSATVTELEEDLGTARRDLIKSEELSSKHQRDLREVVEGPRSAHSNCLLGTGVGTQEGVIRGLGNSWGGEDSTLGKVQCEEGDGRVGSRPETDKGSIGHDPSWTVAAARC